MKLTRHTLDKETNIKNNNKLISPLLFSVTSKINYSLSLNKLFINKFKKNMKLYMSNAMVYHVKIFVHGITVNI